MDTLLGQRYRLGDPIGTGGSARVYQAHDERLDRMVAVKVLDEEAANTADPALRRRFESEARTAAQFIHPNAVTIFDAGSDSGSLYLVMELVSGGSLAQRLADSGPMAPERVAVLGRQVASALAAAHAAGIIHRDVKPANVLLDDGDNAKLADFGIARRFDEIADAMTSAGHGRGHPALRVARAGVRPTARSGDRRVLARRHVVRSGDRHPTAGRDRAGRRPSTRPSRRRADDRGRASRPSSAGRRRSPSTTVTRAPASSPTRSPPVRPSRAEHRSAGGGTAIMPEHLLPGAAAAAGARWRERGSGRRPVRAAPSRSGHHDADDQRRLVAADPAGPTTSWRRAGRRAGSAPQAVARRRPDHRGRARARRLLPRLRRRRRLRSGHRRVGHQRPTRQPSAGDGPGRHDPDDRRCDHRSRRRRCRPRPSRRRRSPRRRFHHRPRSSRDSPSPSISSSSSLTLDSDPDLVGQRGEDLAKELERVLDERPNRIGARAEELRNRIEEWVREEEIDPAIAAVTIMFLDELIATNPSPGPGPDDDD